ncbi:MAG: hypothetical protein HY735_15795, partial [Verrucomicrobia bacterium]|nr:hypothetical protein [Verrucomicrobiota bacterium]
DCPPSSLLGPSFRAKPQSPLCQPPNWTAFPRYTRSPEHHVRLQRTGERSALYELLIEARTRLARAADGAVHYDQSFQYRSGRALFIDWTLLRGEAVRKVFETGCQELADKMVEQLFLEPSSESFGAAVARQESRTPRGANLPPGREDRAFNDRNRLRAGPQHAHNASLRIKSIHSGKTPNSILGSSGSRPRGITDISSPPLPPAALVNLGRIGIISTSTLPNLSLQRPLTKNQAAKEAGADFFCLGGDEELMKTLVVGTAGFAIPALVASGTVGKIAGAGRGVGEKQFRSSDAVLHRTIGELNLQEALRRELQVQAKEATPHPIEIVSKPFPPGQEQQFSQMACVMAGTLAWVPDGQTPATYLTSQRIDTALEIQLVHPAFNGKGTINPQMALNLEVRGRLFRVREGQELYHLALKYRGRERKFAEWAAHDAQPLKDEIKHCAQVVAATMIDRLSLRTLPPEFPMELADARDESSGGKSTPFDSTAPTVHTRAR